MSVSQVLTTEQKDQYLSNNGAMCPFCQSDNIEGDTLQSDGDVWQNVRCLDCGREWQDIYTLTAIDQPDLHD